MSARLDRLAKLEQAATPGPWETRRWPHRATELIGPADPDRPGYRLRVKPATDLVLLAESRNALPALIAVVRAAKVVSDGFAMLEPAEDNPLADLAIALARLDADPAGEEA